MMLLQTPMVIYMGEGAMGHLSIVRRCMHANTVIRLVTDVVSEFPHRGLFPEIGCTSSGDCFLNDEEYREKNVDGKTSVVKNEAKSDENVHGTIGAFFHNNMRRKGSNISFTQQNSESVTGEEQHRIEEKAKVNSSGTTIEEDCRSSYCFACGDNGIAQSRVAFLHLTKPYWLREVAGSNPFETSRFLWMDNNMRCSRWQRGPARWDRVGPLLDEGLLVFAAKNVGDRG